MCQDEIREFLRDHPNGWFTVKEISDGAGLSLNSVNDNLTRMRTRPVTVLFKTQSRRVNKYTVREVTVYKYKEV